MTPARILRLLPLLALLLPLAACSGGGDGGEGNIDDATQIPSWTSNPISPSPANGMIVRLTQVSQTADTVTLAVRVDGVVDLFNLSFDLVYDSSVLDYKSVVEEPFFAGIALDQADTLAAENPAGHLVVGATRLGAVAGVTGSGNVMTLTFVMLRDGTTTLTFDPARPLRGQNSSGVTILDSSNFFGGTLAID